MALSASFLLTPTFLFLLPVFYLVYFVLRGIYRITLHPLAKFPGPKLAGFTRWYEIYYEVYKDGRFAEHIELLHQKYGPLIRITPHQLHISDPEFYDNLYNFQSHIDRPWWTIDNLQGSQTASLHRHRRRAFEPFFSKPAVQRLQFIVRAAVEELAQRLHEKRESSTPTDLSLLARCLTSDLITEYIFGEPYGFLTDPVASEKFFAANNTIFQTLYLFRESTMIDLIFKSMRLIPPSWLPEGHLSHSFVPFMQNLMARTVAARERHKSSGPSKAEERGHRVLMDEYLSLDLSEHDKTLQVQFDHAGLFITAGLETVAFTTEQAVFYVLNDPTILARLRDELTTAIPDANAIPEWSELESLPYLTAVIQESLRMGVGVMSRLPRKNTKEDMQYGDWVIPKDTFVGMSQRLILYNSDIFPNPHEFDPERWLQGEESKALDRYLVSFSKGSRRCIGIHLAYAELYTLLATIFRRFQLELYETTVKDVIPKIDYFIPKPEHGSLGVRVLVK